MKQEKAKKMPKWLLPVIIAAAVLVVAGIVLAIFLGSQGQGNGPDAVQSELYWNIDRVKFIDPETNMSTREPAADGDYVIRFSLNGEVVSYKCADKRLVNAIDFMDALGLVFDADGMIVDALDPKSFSKEVARDFFIKSISEDQLIVNSSIAMNGMETVVPLSAVTGIYNVDPNTNGEGQKDTCQIMDKVTIFGQKDGDAITHVFITERAKGDGVYYRVEQCYDKTKGSTTREPDENGVYTITFAYEGQQLDLKCKDEALVSEIDKQNDPKHHMGLIFDEEGYIIEFVNAAVALRGKMAYRLMTVTAVGGNIATIEDKVGDGADGSADLPIDADCDIFLVEDGCEAEFIGQRTDKLQLNDMVTVYTDLEGKPILIYITRRTIDADMYYNVSRKYSKDTQETTRKPDDNGWYNYEMITVGKKVELRTKDKAIATKVDSFTGKVMGLKLNGKTIVDVYHPYCLSGYGHVGEGRYVTDLMGQIIRIVSSSNFEKGGNYITSPEGSLVIDVSGDYSAKTGAPVELRQGDCVTCYTNSKKDITHGVVSGRYYEGTKQYYNITIAYDSTKKETTRVPDKDGYYVFDMMCEGKEVQVKTKDKAMASFIDADTYQFRSLKVSGGIIKAAYKDTSAMMYSTKQASNVYYDSTNPDGTINYYYMSSGKRVDKTTGHAVTDKTVIYDYSEGYVKYKGEKTTLKKGDMIQGFGSLQTKQMLVIYVKERKVESKLYWYTSRKYNSATLQTTREPDADGWYWVDMISEDGEIKTLKTKDKKLMSKVDSFATACGLKLDGDVILRAFGPSSVKGVMGAAASYYDAMKISGSKVTFVRNRPASSSTGKSAQYTLAKGNKVVNVTSYTDNYGKKDKIEIGDRVTNYVNDNGEIICTFITNKNTHKAGAVSYCDHCGKKVWWEHFVGTVYKADSHYYIPNNRSSSNKAIGYTAQQLAADPSLKEYELVFDLNGKIFTVDDYNIAIGGKAAIIDTVGEGRLKLTGKTVMNVKNVDLTYVVDVASDAAILKLDGKVNTKGEGVMIKLAQGAKIDINDLSSDSKIVVSGYGAITTPRSDIEKYLSVFVPASSGDTIEIRDNALYYVPETTEYTTEEIIAATTSDAYAAQFANGGIVEAICYACGQKVDWEPVTGSIGDGVSGHFYLDNAPDYCYQNMNYLNTGGKTCLFLNNKQTSYRGRMRVTKEMNIMGNGIVTRVNNDTYPEIAMFDLTSANTKLTIYGGTFVKDQPGAALFAMNGGTSSGIATIYGGTFNSVTGEVLNIAKDGARFNLLGGTMSGPATVEIGKLTIGDAQIKGDMTIGRMADVTLTGKPVITGTLDLTSGAKLTLKDLATDVSVLVKANGVFTQSNADAQNYVDAETFRVPEGYQKVQKFGSALWTAPNGVAMPEPPAPLTVDEIIAMANSDEFAQNFASGESTVLAFCPVCNEEVAWKRVGSGAVGSSAEGHYYLNSADGYRHTSMNYLSTSAKVCLYLNNKNVEISGRFRVSKELNILGNGTITRVDNLSYATTPMFSLDSANTKLNVYGGLFINQQAGVALFDMNGTNSTGIANIYGGTFASVSDQTLLMTKDAARFNLLGGSFETNAQIDAGQLTIGNAQVKGDMTIGLSANVTLTGKPEITGALDLTSGAKLTLKDLATDASVLVKANGAFTQSISNTADYLTANTFTVPAGYQAVKAVGNALWTAPEGYEPPAPTTPEWSENTIERIDQWTAYYGADFNGESVVTDVCPICGATDVTWTAKSSGRFNSTSAAHFYLADSFEMTSTYELVGSNQAAPICIYLNNKTYTAAGTFTIRNQLNIFDDNATAGGGMIDAVAPSTATNAYIQQPLLRVMTADGELNIYGGDFEARQTVVEKEGTALNPNGTALIELEVAGAKANIYGGTFTNTGAGDVIIANAGELKLAGVPTIAAPGIVLADGVVMNIDDLAATSSVAVNGENGKIIAAASDNAAAVKDRFTVVGAAGLSVAVNADKQLYITDGVVAPPAEPTTQDLIAEWLTEYAATFTAASAATKADVETATCPVCGAENVTWIARTSNNAVNPNGGATHYYLYSDVVRNTFDAVGSSQDAPVCIYLNNKTYSTTGCFQIKNTLNIFDDPSVTGGKVLGADGTAKGGNYIAQPLFRLTKDANNAAPALNIYYGEYEGAQPHVAGTNDNGTALVASQVAEAQAYIYGATLSNTAYGDTLRVTAGSVVLENCALTGGSGYVGSDGVSYGGNVYMGGGELTLKNVTVSAGTATKGSIYVAAGSTLNVIDTTVNGDLVSGAEGVVTLSGNPTIAALDLTSGAKVTLGELAETAQIAVKANGVFTEPTEKAAEYAALLKPAAGYWTITAVDNTLQTRPTTLTAEAMAIVETANSAEFAAQFANGGTVTAVCPVCGGEAVEWTPIGAGTAESPKSSQTKLTGHVYYDQDTWTTSQNILTGDTASACLFLNGKTVTGAGRIRATKTLNVIGEGTIIRADSDKTDILWTVASANSRVNIYGGTYINQDPDLVAMSLTNDAAVVNFYVGSLTGDVTATNGTLNIFDATVTGNLNVTAPAVLNQAALPVQAASQENGDEASQTVKS